MIDDLDPQIALQRVVRVDDRSDPVLELRDDFARAVVGGWIRAEQNQHVDIELHGIAADLHVALFEDVEQADLHEFVKLGQLIHREDATVQTWDQAEVERVFDAHADAGGQFRRVDLADDVGEFRAGGEPLGVALVAWPPGDRHFVGRHASDQLPAALCDRVARIVVDRNVRIVDVGDLLVEKRGHQPHEPAFRLALLAEEQHVVLGENGDVQLGDDGVVVADDAGIQSSPACSLARKLSWISCLTVFDRQPLDRNSARVVGRVNVVVGIVTIS